MAKTTKRNKQQQHHKKKEQPKRLEPLFEPNHALSGKDLKQGARELLQREIRPTLKQANRQLNYLGIQEKAALDRASGAGQQGSANISSYYDNLAKQETAFLNAQNGSQAQLQQFLQGNAAQTQQGIAAAGGAVSKNLSPTDQPIGANARLSEQQMEYAGQAAKAAQAQNANAATQAKQYSQYASELAGSAGMRGGEQLGAYNKQIANRLAEIGNEYGENRNKVLNTKAELLEQRPELYHKALEALRKESRETYQGNRVLGIKEEANKAGTNYAKVNGQEEIRRLHAEEAKRAREIKETGGSNKELAELKHQFRLEELAIEEGMYGSGGGGGKGGGASSAEWGEWGSKAMSWLRSAEFHPKQLTGGYSFTKEGTEKNFSAKQVRKKAYDSLVNRNVPPAVAKEAVKRFTKKGITKKRGRGHFHR